MISTRALCRVLGGLLVVLLATACGDSEAKAKRRISIDGSSTVYPISAAAAEGFYVESEGKGKDRPRLTVKYSGTGGGFKKFYIGETDLSDASRPIKKKELKKCGENNIDFIELPVAYDGICVCVSADNKFLYEISVAELKKIWEPGSKVQTWNQVRPDWPATKVDLFAPGIDSGTFDYFTKAVNGKEDACRNDVSLNEDDNVLVEGVAGSDHAMGFFGFAYYIENTSKLRALKIRVGAKDKAVEPTIENIEKGVYQPLSRPIFIYVSVPALKQKPIFEEFIEYYLANAGEKATMMGYIPLPDAVYKYCQKRFRDRMTGSMFLNVELAGVDLFELYGIRRS